MAITDELRKWGYGFCGDTHDVVTAIADRIDTEHEKALREAYTVGRGDGMAMTNAKDAQAEYLRGKNDGYDAGWDACFASADDWCAQHEDEMAKRSWYRAVDMYEKPVLIGDMMQGMRAGGGWCEPFKVVRIDFNGHGWVAYEDVKTGHLLSKCRHYHVPTVEDLLDEFASAYGRIGVEDEEHQKYLNLIAEYAAKLRLAGSDAE